MHFVWVSFLSSLPEQGLSISHYLSLISFLSLSLSVASCISLPVSRSRAICSLSLSLSLLSVSLSRSLSLSLSLYTVCLSVCLSDLQKALNKQRPLVLSKLVGDLDPLRFKEPTGHRARKRTSTHAHTKACNQRHFLVSVLLARGGQN